VRHFTPLISIPLSHSILQGACFAYVGHRR
jgi:hypothetical protein